jgi:prevent-host-death family protein
MGRLDLGKLKRANVMKTVSIHEAKTRLSRLVDQAASGEDVVISRNGRPVARLTRIESPPRRVRFGVLKGRIVVPDDFDKPLPATARKAFEGSCPTPQYSRSRSPRRHP